MSTDLYSNIDSQLPRIDMNTASNEFALHGTILNIKITGLIPATFLSMNIKLNKVK